MNPFHREHEFQEISEVNVVPLADVSLVLLIILLVLSPMMAQHRLKVLAAAEKAAPEAAAEPTPATTAPQRPPELVLVVGLAADRVTVDDRTFTGSAELAGYVAGMLLLRGDKKVFLAPQPDVTHGRVVETLELLKSAGAASVALVQSAPPPPEAAP